MRNKILAVLMIIAGIAIGLYVGGWLMFIGGIVQVIQEVRAETLSTLNIGIGIAKIMFAAFVGTFCAFVLVVPGQLLWDKTEHK